MLNNAGIDMIDTETGVTPKNVNLVPETLQRSIGRLHHRCQTQDKKLVVQADPSGKRPVTAATLVPQQCKA